MPSVANGVRKPMRTKECEQGEQWYTQKRRLTVSEPVAGSGDRGLLGTSSKRERLADDDPGDGTPCTSERGDKHARGDNHDNADSLVALGVLGSSHGGEDAHPSSLPESTDEERPASTKLLNHVQAEEGHDDVDRSEDELGQDGIVDTSTGENGGAVVKEADSC